MNAKLTSEFFAGRREKAFDAMGENAALIVSAGSTTPNHVKFRQESGFFYLTGFPEPNAAAVLLSNNGERSYTLFVPPKDPVSERWDGKRAGVEGALNEYNADNAHPIDELEEKLKPLVDAAWRIYLRADMSSRRGQTLHRLCRASATSSGRSGRGALEFCDLDWFLANLRVHKTPEEIDMIRSAAEITREAYAETVPQIRPGGWEYEIEAALDGAFRKKGGDGPAYQSIVGGGNNSTCLHYVSNNDPLRGGDVLLIDAGAMRGHYASDVTRTYPINGRFSSAQREMYEAVLRAQKAMIEAARPGIPLKQLHELSVRLLTESMVELGWLDGRGVDAHIEEKTYRQYYMHGSGHHLGLDVHDPGPAEIDGEPFLLGEGAVFTVEPGLYVSEDDESVPEAYRGVGVRIEDDALITADGHENLTAGIPKEADEVEALVQSG